MTFEFSPSALQQRVTAIVIALIPLAVLVAMLASYVSDIALHRERVMLLKRERADYAALIQNAPLWKSDVARLRAIAAGGSLVFANSRVDAAAQQLLTAVSSIVTDEGGAAVQSKAEINATGEDGPTEIRANVSFTADISAVTHILFRLRQTRPILIPVQLSIRDAVVQTVAAAPAPHRLQVELTVAGYASVP